MLSRCHPAWAGVQHRGVGKETDHRTAVVLTAIAGFVDAAGFLALFGLFTAHVTGNLVVVGAALAREHTERAAVRLAVIPIFMLGVAATTLVVRRLRAQGVPPLVPLFALEAAALVAFLALGLALGSRLEADAWALFAVGGAAMLAMGIQNGTTRLVIAGLPTTMMTGNVTQFAIDLVDWLAPARGSARRDAWPRLATTGSVVLGFVAGAASGALTMRLVGFPSTLAPILGLAWLIVCQRRRDAAAPGG